MEQPMKFELAINLKTTKQSGVTIPPVRLFYRPRQPLRQLSANSIA